MGGSYASRTLPGELTLALEVGPTEAEYSTTVSAAARSSSTAMRNASTTRTSPTG